MDIEPDTQPPICSGCGHYYITHDARFRYGCRALKFKSKRQPFLDVLEASGQLCLHFRKKQRNPK